MQTDRPSEDLSNWREVIKRKYMKKRTIIIPSGLSSGKKTLHLTIKKKWFDMITSGEKIEEYREIKAYWKTRLKKYYESREPFDIQFKNGYAKDAPIITKECEGILMGKPIVAWTDKPGEKVFILGRLS